MTFQIECWKKRMMTESNEKENGGCSCRWKSKKANQILVCNVRRKITGERRNDQIPALQIQNPRRDETTNFMSAD